MMKIYRLRQARGGGVEYRFQAERRWHLPGVECEVCDSTWANVGLDYPLIDLSSLADESAYRAGVVSVARYRELRDSVLQNLASPVILRPGTGFGPLIGTARGTVNGGAWPQPWSLALDESSFAVVKERVRGVRGRPTNFQWKRPAQSQLIELQVEPRVKLHRCNVPFDMPPPCENCGRWVPPLPEDIVLEATSIPSDTDVFREHTFTSLIFATESFVEALQEAGVEDAMPEEVAVA